MMVFIDLSVDSAVPVEQINLYLIVVILFNYFVKYFKNNDLVHLPSSDPVSKTFLEHFENGNQEHQFDR